MDTLGLEEIKQIFTPLIWSHVSVKTGNKYSANSCQLLNNVSGMARSGEILAIIGASGVGKTTLMNALGGRHTQNLHISGDIYLNNTLTTPLQRTRSGLIGYIEQYERFIETMTLEKHLIFHAMLRMPHGISDRERHLRVMTVISQLHLIDCKKTPIGRLSGGERKRLAFATALLTNPNILLIDEPTSGLDTYLAKTLMEIIQSMAVTHNQAVIVVLHQPSSVILDTVNKLYLLVEGGQQAFYGSKTEAEEFFRKKCQLTASSLDEFIEQVSAPADIADVESIISQKIAAEAYVLSDNAKTLETNIHDYIASINNKMTNELNVMERSSFFRQIKWLLWRSFSSIKYSPQRTTKLIFRLVLMALLFGVVFFQLNPNTYGYVLNVNALLIVLFMPLSESNMSLILVEVPNERQVIIWEYRRQLYSIGAYYLSRLVLDTCYHIISSIVFMSIILLLTGLTHGFAFIGAVILVTITACSLASLMAAISSTARTGLLWLRPMQNLLVSFTGYFINLNSIPSYLSWLKYISYIRYNYELMLTVQWHPFQDRLRCSRISSNLLATNITSFHNDTCSGTGNDVLQCFDISYSNTGMNVFMHFVLIFVFHILAFTITLFRIRRAA